MPKKGWVTDSNGLARKLSKGWVFDANGVARKINKGWVFDSNGLARQIFGYAQYPGGYVTIYVTQDYSSATVSLLYSWNWDEDPTPYIENAPKGTVTVATTNPYYGSFTSIPYTINIPSVISNIDVSIWGSRGMSSEKGLTSTQVERYWDNGWNERVTQIDVRAPGEGGWGYVKHIYSYPNSGVLSGVLGHTRTADSGMEREIYGISGGTTTFKSYAAPGGNPGDGKRGGDGGVGGGGGADYYIIPGTGGQTGYNSGSSGRNGDLATGGNGTSGRGSNYGSGGTGGHVCMYAFGDTSFTRIYGGDRDFGVVAIRWASTL